MPQWYGRCGHQVLPFTFEAHMGVLALGGIGTNRVVEPQVDGAAIFCPVVGTKGRTVPNGAGCCTVTTFAKKHDDACAHSSWSRESHWRLGL